MRSTRCQAPSPPRSIQRAKAAPRPARRPHRSRDRAGMHRAQVTENRRRAATPQTATARRPPRPPCAAAAAPPPATLPTAPPADRRARAGAAAAASRAAPHRRRHRRFRTAPPAPRPRSAQGCASRSAPAQADLSPASAAAIKNIVQTAPAGDGTSFNVVGLCRRHAGRSVHRTAAFAVARPGGAQRADGRRRRPRPASTCAHSAPQAATRRPTASTSP